MRTLIALLLGPALLWLWPASAWAVNLPELPQVFIDTTYSPPTGNTFTVNSGGNFQTALNNAQLGDTIVLQAGATFNGPFTLPNKTTGSGWIYIRSSNYTSLPPPGTRVSPADAANMPKITIAPFSGGAINTASGAHHYRFVGIEFKPVAGNFIFDLVAIGGNDNTLSTLPHNITFDRCYLHGDPTAGTRRGIAMNGRAIAVVDSYLWDFKEPGADTQALWAFNSPGPLKIFNNYLEAAGENFLAGGADPRIVNLVPSDIEVRRNHFFKPLIWLSQSWSVKNLFELKNAQRVLVEGNIFENNWIASQNGFAILFTPRNQDGTAPWSVTQDITFRLNKIINVGQGFNISGRDTDFSSQVTRRVLIENNFLTVSRLQGGIADGKIFGITNGPIDLTIRHNTGLIVVAGGTTAFSFNSPRANGFDFRDNLLSSGLYGFSGTGTGGANGTLNTYYSDFSFFKNAIIADDVGPSGYPAGQFFPANNAAVGFVNLAQGNYRLAPTSPFAGAASDGKDIGADISAIEAAYTGVDPLADPDNDGAPSGVEMNEGINPLVKDNDIFANARLFTMQQYRDFLGREGDAAGINFYTTQIIGGTQTRAQVIETFLNSPEFQGGLPQCTRLYFSFFGRIPDYAGLNFQVAEYKSGVPLATIAQNFANSPEFTNTYGSLTNDQYINLVYQNVLGRAPDPAGYNFYFTALQNGTMTRGQMMVGFSESPEFTNLTLNDVFVVSVYVGTLKRSPDVPGLDFYVNLLQTGTTRNQIITSFINSPEYRSRFLP